MSYVTGYSGQFDPARPAVIAAAGQSSAGVSMGGMELVGIQLPATFTGTTLTFEVATAIDGTYQPLYKSADGSAVSFTVAQGRFYAVDPALFKGIQFLKVKSGSVEGAERTIYLALKG